MLAVMVPYPIIALDVALKARRYKQLKEGRKGKSSRKETEVCKKAWLVNNFV